MNLSIYSYLFKNTVHKKVLYKYTYAFKAEKIVYTMNSHQRLSIQWILTSRCEIFFLSLSQVVRTDICKRIYDRKFLKDFVTALKNE